MLRKILTLTFVATLISFSGSVADAQSPELEKTKLEKDGRAPLKKCWDYTFSAGSGRFVAGSDDKIYISEPNGNLRAISALTNETIWITELGGSIEAMQAVSGLGVAAATNVNDSNAAQSTIRILDSSTGLTKYSSPVAIGRVRFLKDVGSRLVVFSTSGEIEAFDFATGQSIWKAKSGSPISAEPAVFENTIAVSTTAKKIEFFAVNDGSSLVASILTQREIRVIGFRENQMLLTGDDRGNVTNYRDQAGTVWWKFKSGARIGTIAETNEGILVGSYDNFVYMISKYSGDVRWKIRLEGRVVFRPLVVGKEAFFTVSGQDDLVVINTDNGKILEQASFGTDRLPIADPIIAAASIKVFPIAGGLQAFSANGCK